ncbi:MAG: hypothetical protein WBD02_05090 [Acidimicrobiia bacterium]
MPGARILIRLGLLAIGIALQSVIVQHTILDRDRVADASTAALNSPDVQQWISNAIEDQTRPAIGLGPEETKRLAAALPQASGFRDAFRSAIAELHDRIFSSDAPDVLSASTQQEISAGVKDAATKLGITNADVSRITLPFDQVDLPNLSAVKAALDLAAPIAGGLGAALLLIGVAIDRKPNTAVRKIGWGLAWNSLIPLAPFVIVPWVAQKRADNAGTAAFAAIMHALGRDLIVPAFAIAAIGVGLVVGASMMKHASGARESGWRLDEEERRRRRAGQFR